jgi:hypothetical protein
VTPEQWERLWFEHFAELRHAYPTRDLYVLQRATSNYMLECYGPKPEGLPLQWRIAGVLIRRKLADFLEASPMMKRILTSIGFALAVAMPLYTAAQAEKTPGGVEVIGMEWAAIAWAACVAGYGNYKTNTTYLAPNRTIWTPEERLVETAKMEASAKVEDAKVVAAEKVADAKVVAAAKVEGAKPGR